MSETSQRRNAMWWYRRPGVVYFFGAGDKAIKIGVTTIFGDLGDDDDQNDDLNSFDLETFDLWSFDPNTYVLKDDDLARGVRDCIRQRHKQIQSSNHETIALQGVIPFLDGDLPARRAELCERKLHEHFAHLRRFKPHTVGSEWFSREIGLLDYIEKYSCHPEKFGITETVIGSPLNR